MTSAPAVNLKVYIGKPGGPRTWEEAERWGRHEAAMKEVDHLGAREGDFNERTDVKSDCVCRYCRFYRGEGGVRLIMCEQEWERLPSDVRRDIAESCSD